MRVRISVIHTTHGLLFEHDIHVEPDCDEAEIAENAESFVNDGLRWDVKYWPSEGTAPVTITED